jgi:hypothetical protein
MDGGDIVYEVEHSPLRFYDGKRCLDPLLDMAMESKGMCITLYPRTGTLTNIVVPNGFQAEYGTNLNKLSAPDRMRLPNGLQAIVTASLNKYYDLHRKSQHNHVQIHPRGSNYTFIVYASNPRKKARGSDITISTREHAFPLPSHPQ